MSSCAPRGAALTAPKSTRQFISGALDIVEEYLAEAGAPLTDQQRDAFDAVRADRLADTG